LHQHLAIDDGDALRRFQRVLGQLVAGDRTDAGDGDLAGIVLIAVVFRGVIARLLRPRHRGNQRRCQSAAQQGAGYQAFDTDHNNVPKMLP
jgi:hypothetical protein